MSKDTVSAWDTTPANNTDVGGVDLAENSMRPRDVNNAIRTMMAQVAAGIDGGEFVSGFSSNVQGTGRFGRDDTGGIFSYEAVGSSGAGYGVANRSQAAFSYTGGTPGAVNSTETVITTTSAGVADYVWGLLSILTNSATAGENVAAYFQGTMQAAGPTWGAVIEAIDNRHTANPATGLIGLELDIAANGTDSSNQRLAMHIVGRRDDTGGAAVEFAEAIRIDSSAASSKFKKGINFQSGSSVGTGIDMSGATITGDAIHLADSQKIAFDTADGRYLKFDGTRLVYGTATNANAVRISDAGFIGVNVAPATVFDAAGTGDTQLRLVDGGTVDVRLRASSGSAVGFFGTVSNHDMIVMTNGVEAIRLDTSKNLLAKAAIRSDSATSGIGYATGAGGTATQATSKSTGVTLSKASGQITMNGAALSAATIVSFTLTNTAIAAGDVLVLNHVSAGTPGAYTLNARCGAGSAIIDVRNNTAGSLSEAIVIGFTLIKGVTA